MFQVEERRHGTGATLIQYYGCHATQRDGVTSLFRKLGIDALPLEVAIEEDVVEMAPWTLEHEMLVAELGHGYGPDSTGASWTDIFSETYPFLLNLCE